MCLERKGTFKPCKVGYKILELNKNDGSLLGEFQRRLKPRKVGVWLDESEFRDYGCMETLLTEKSNSEYPTGWHIYNRLEDAMYWRPTPDVVVKVSVKEPVAVGYQGTMRITRITVAKKIKILRTVA